MEEVLQLLGDVRIPEPDIVMRTVRKYSIQYQVHKVVKKCLYAEMHLCMFGILACNVGFWTYGNKNPRLGFDTP